MPVSKIILFYVFAPLSDPAALRLWQRDLCENLGLRGRILLSPQGINVTLGGELGAVKKYLRKTRDYPAFTAAIPTWSEGSGLDSDGFSLDFPRLRVRVRDEIVSFGAPGELRVDARGVVAGGTKVSPQQLHELVDEQKRMGDDVVFFDGRNSFEAEIGRFEGAVVPSVGNTREFIAELDSGKYDHLKDKPVVTYCTGGIRCEVLSSLMIARGFENVFQLDGGIVRYGETFGDSGLWKGSLYVFDQRMSVEFTPDARSIASCHRCSASTSRMQNCHDLACRTQLVTCQDCSSTATVSCELHTDSAAALSAL